MLFGDLFAQTDGGFQVNAVFQIVLQRMELGQLVLHQEVDAVESNAAIVADNAAAAVGVRQTGQHARFTAAQNILGIDVEHALVMGFTVFGEDFFQRRVQLTAVNLTGAFHHFDAAERDNGAFQRSFSLQADDFFQRFIDIAGVVRGNGRGEIGVEIDGGMRAVFNFDTFQHVVPQFSGRFGRACKEGLIALIRRVVPLNKIANVDAVLPFALGEPFPGRSLFCIQIGHDIPALSKKTLRWRRQLRGVGQNH